MGKVSNLDTDLLYSYNFVDFKVRGVPIYSVTLYSVQNFGYAITCCISVVALSLVCLDTEVLVATVQNDISFLICVLCYLLFCPRNITF